MSDETRPTAEASSSREPDTGRSAACGPSERDYEGVKPIEALGGKRGKVHYGGQAVIEGVMMRGPERIAVAVRTPDGEVNVHSEPFVSASRRHRILRLPVVRGGLTLIESLALGIRALNYSASAAMEAEEEAAGDGGTEPRESEDVKLAPEKADWKTKFALTGTMVFAFGLGILFFFYIPLVLSDLLIDWLGSDSSILFNVIDGIIRVVFFIAYIWGISQWREMRRVFEYHGAEHKTIFMHEAGDELTPDNARRYATRHPRCGTSFLLIVMVVSILVFMLTGRPQTVAHRLLRLLLIPVIAGVSYEIMKLAALNGTTWWARLISAPGVWLQSITTKEPDDDQVEVAIAALNGARGAEAEAPAADAVVAEPSEETGRPAPAGGGA